MSRFNAKDSMKNSDSVLVSGSSILPEGGGQESFVGAVPKSVSSQLASRMSNRISVDEEMRRVVARKVDQGY